jgi:ubiquinone/menaquinone biosynthesis C-methylase UbiE
VTSAPAHAAYRDGVAWAHGPQAVYDRLAAAALATLPDDLTGTTALDAGAGTGAATRVLLSRGADVDAVDTSTSMLAELHRQTGGRVRTVVGDVRDLPLADGRYDYAVAACVLNHLETPETGVAELARVCRPGGRVVATTFGAEDHPVKPAVDAVLAGYGFVTPEWYRSLKSELIPRLGTPQGFAQVAVSGGLADATVRLVDVDLSDLPLPVVVSYRLGLAHVAPFVQELDAGTAAALRRDAVTAIASLPRLRLSLLVLDGVAA